MEPDFAPKLRPNSTHRSSRTRPINLSALVRKFAGLLRRRFAVEIEHNPRLFRKRLLRLLTTALPARHGRPRIEAVSRATEMRAQGKDWRAVYVACIPTTVAGDSRQVAQSRLRSAVRARRRSSYRTLERN